MCLASCDKSPAAADFRTGEASTTSTRDETGSTPANSPRPTGKEDRATNRCEQAYSDLQELVKGLEEQLGSTDSELPERGEFLASCNDLPVEIQECMVFEYAMANQKQCKERLDSLEPEQREAAQDLMGN